jgi:hypothetical protein
MFTKGNSRLKKDILMTLGKKITIKDGNLYLEPNEWLIPIRDSYPTLEEELLRLEPAITSMNKGKMEALLPIRSRWQTIRDSNQKKK